VDNTESIDQIQGNELQSAKVLKDRQLLIQRGGKTYTVQGSLVYRP
jgi:hypothetical protein